MKHAFFIGFLLLYFLTTSGCDSFGNGTETVALNTSLDFCFTFNGSTIQPNQSTVLTSFNEQDLTNFLQENNFLKADILEAEVTSASIETIFPIDVSTAFLDAVRFGFSTTGLSNVEIATQSGFGTSFDAVPLFTVENQNFVNHLKAPVFRGFLQMTPNSIEPSESYELQVRVNLVVRVPF